MLLYSRKLDWILGGFEYLHADDLVANPGSGGATFRTDQLLSGQHVPYTKLMSGTADDTAVIPGDATNGLFVQVKASAAVPVTDNSGSLTVDNAGTFAVQAAQSGTWTVQPGNTANTTPWKVDASSAAVPVTDNSGSLTTDFSGQKTLDYDSGAGTDTVLGVGILLPANGGAVAGGTAANPVQVSLANTAANSTAVKVDGSAVTQPISAASLPLPSGAATAAKQPALGTAGTASTDVITVQGIASMTALKVDGSAVTQPVSGTVTANAGTGPFPVAGTVASGAADSGNPVKVGGKYNSTPITLTDGQRGDAQLDANGYLKVNVAAGGASGGTSSSFGSAFPSTGTAIGAKDSSGTNMAALNLDASGNLKVNLAAGGGSGGTALSDKAAFTEGSTSFTPVGGVYNETIAADPTEDQAAAFRITAKRALHVNLRDSSGNELSAGAQYAEDAAHTSGDLGTLALVRRSDTASSSSGTDGDYSTLNTDSSGRLWVNASGAAVPITDNSGSITVDNAGTFAVQADGSVASGSADSGAPVKIGGKYNSTPITLTNGQRGDAQLDANGYLKVNVAAGGASGGTSSSFGSAVPSTGTAAGFSDGTNMQLARVFDLDSGAGTQYGLGVNLRASASGGSVELASSTSSPSGSEQALIVRNIPSGTQTVSGTVTANAGTGNFATNLAQVNGSTVSTAATGVQKVGLVGNAGATVDSTVGAGSAPTNQVVVGSVYNTSAPAPTNGQAMAQQADQAGNLRTFPGIALTALSVWNSGTSLNATQNIFTNSGAAAVLVQIVQSSGSFSAGAITFEITFDGSNWVTASADAIIDPTSTTNATQAIPYTLVTSTNKPFLILCKGAQGLRIKLSTAITGTGTVTPNYALLPYSPVQQTVLGAGSATIGSLAANQSVNLAQIAATTTATGNGTASAGCQRVTIASDNTAFSVNAAQSGTWTVQPGNTANTTPWLVTPTPATSGGLSVSRLLSAASTNATSVKGSAGQVYGWFIYNTTSSAKFFKLYNKASAPTVGTDTPFMTIPIPATSGTNVEYSMGIPMGTGIAFALTGAVGDADTTALAANDVVVNLLYK